MTNQETRDSKLSDGCVIKKTLFVCSYNFASAESLRVITHPKHFTDVLQQADHKHFFDLKASQRK